jgi:hypothetical protein
MSSVVSMPKIEEESSNESCWNVDESTVPKSKQRSLSPGASTTASDPSSAQDCKSDCKSTESPSSDDGKSQLEDSMENLHILRFTRCPREFRDALLEGPLLQDCQESMKSIGLQAEMSTGSKIFCKPGLYKNALEAVEAAFPNLQDSLRPYHVITTEEFRPTVLKVVNGLARGLKVKCKEESVIARVSDSQWVSVECSCLERLPRKAQQEVEAPVETGSAEAAVTADERQPTKSKKAKKSKSNAKASAQAQGLEIGPLFDDIFPAFPMAPVDPAVALSFMNPMFPTVPEADWSTQYLFRQALEEQQAMLTHAIACNLHAQRMMFEGPVRDGQADEGIRLDRL